ncbi:Tn3 family transposase [Candidatus Paracaedibacter symbiosus]|uniref:Tn3 family transposase n=1 Tax=Candidatus Paracaedibacter symbiosus TaxID=244582 RepID=UPI000509A36C|nr:Tn3 family transposase [Candidatus Paracaedibacter symbiosus]
MANKIPRLLAPAELLDIYGIPLLGDIERQEYFTFNEEESKALKDFKGTKEAVYFAICLVFFKIKQTLVDFNYQNVTTERQHVMERYFPQSLSPRALPSVYNKIRAQNKVLALCGYQRFTREIGSKIKNELHKSAVSHPRQRQLCKELLNSLVKNRIAIPGYTTLQDIISSVWNYEKKRIVQSYLRYTNKNQRKTIFSLLYKTDEHYRIISIKQDMKGFNTHDLWKELSKHTQLKEIFNIAKTVLPQLGLPTTTIAYYANLINYYDGPSLKKLNPHAIGLYLLCYTFTRYQALNDNLLEAFKKRALEYKKKATDSAKAEALKQLDLIQEARERASEILITIKNHPYPTIPKKAFFEYIPEDQLLPAAQLLVDESLNKDLCFWKYIDSIEDFIKLNLRKLFLGIDFVVTNNDALKENIAYVKSHLLARSVPEGPCPPSVQTWIGKQYRKHLIENDKIIFNRLEFFLYMQMVYHLGTNKLTLQYSIKHKKVEDELYDDKRWTREKKTILKQLDYSKLLTPIQATLDIKNTNLTALYKTVNDSVENVENTYVKIKNDKNGNRVWRLNPLELYSDPNDSLFALLQQRSIVDIMQFVNHKTQFCRAFDPILPKSAKTEQDPLLIGAVVLSNAIRVGPRKMANMSDLKESALLTAEDSYVRLETLFPAIDKINNSVSKLPIYKEWYILGLLHGSLDGLKLETSIRNKMARHSSKYFGDGTGVSAYNEIVNWLSISSRLIGCHDYEGHHAFEMVHHQNTSEIKPTHLSTDKHGLNAINFALFDLMDMTFAPRIPKPHRETFWGFGSPKDYEGMLIKPTKFVEENLVREEWDNIQRFSASLLTGEAAPSSIIRKFCSKDYVSKTKRAIVQYSHLVRSEFLLTYLHDPEFRRAILYALNRGEQYNGLYRAISILNNGELRGKTEIEMEVWHQCTRLIAAVIHYYNAYILNSLYVNSKDEEEKRFLASLSPTAWVHVNLLGYYQFYTQSNVEWIENWLRQWDWRKSAGFVEKY